MTKAALRAAPRCPSRPRGSCVIPKRRLALYLESAGIAQLALRTFRLGAARLRALLLRAGAAFRPSPLPRALLRNASIRLMTLLGLPSDTTGGFLPARLASINSISAVS